MTPRRERDESGAVAVIAAVTLTLLIGCAALAFDLGNAWARARAVQLQADVSAMSAGHLLPMTSANRDAVAAEVATYLNRNQASGSPTVGGADLLDGDLTDGEVTFTHADGSVCADQCVQMSVLAPPAVVDFAFAGVLGFDGTDVQRRATVQAFSELPPAEDVIPLWLPSGCGFGVVDGDTTQGGSSGGSQTADADASGASDSADEDGGGATGTVTTAPLVTPTPAGTHTLTGDAVTLSVGGTATVRGWQIEAVPSKTKKASVRLVAPDGAFYVDYAVSDASPSGSLPVPEFEMGPEVSQTPGPWRAYALLGANGNGKDALTYSTSFIEVRVSGPTTDPVTDPPTEPGPDPAVPPTETPTSVPVGCGGQDRGNFGQLDSPRVGLSSQQGFAANLALGLDHQLVPYDFSDTEPTKSCDGLADAQEDRESKDGNNCILGDPGNDGPKLFDGLIGGGDYVGRLDAANGATTCPGRANRAVGGEAINDDVLSCFLRNGASLDAIAQESGVTSTMLDAEVLDSPRFVWLPLVVATDRAQRGFQPIVDFVPAFITGETTTVSGSATPAENGVEVNGNSVKVVRLFAFNKEALPVAEQSPTVAYRPGLGRPLVRLVG